MECCYNRPQTKFAKVMFLHLSVRHSVHSGAVNACWDTPPDQAPPWSRAPPEIPVGPGTPLCAVHAGRYGQQAGGTHPTGMHSCYLIDFKVSS